MVPVVQPAEAVKIRQEAPAARPSDRQLAVMDAVSSNCNTVLSVKEHVSERFSINTSEVGSECRAVLQCYGVDTLDHATGLAIEYGHVPLKRSKESRVLPSSRLMRTMDLIAEGKTLPEIAGIMDIPPKAPADYYAALLSFYDNAANMPTALRRSYEWGHRWRRADYCVSPLAVSHTHAGIVLPKQSLVELSEVEARYLYDRAAGMTNPALAKLYDASEGGQKRRAMRVFRKLGARSISEAVLKATILGFGDLDIPSERTLLGRPLAAREIEVGSGITLGLSNPAIAAQLRVSKNSIKTTERRLRSMIGVSSRVHIGRQLIATRYIVPVPRPPHLDAFIPYKILPYIKR